MSFLDLLVLAWDEESEFEITLESRGGGISGMMGQEQERKVNFTLGHDTDFSAEDLQGIIEEALTA